jgi:hypothetical protein
LPSSDWCIYEKKKNDPLLLASAVWTILELNRCCFFILFSWFFLLLLRVALTGNQSATSHWSSRCLENQVIYKTSFRLLLFLLPKLLVYVRISASSYFLLPFFFVIFTVFSLCCVCLNGLEGLVDTLETLFRIAAVVRVVQVSLAVLLSVLCVCFRMGFTSLQRST